MSLRRDDLLDRVLPGELAIVEEMPACDLIGAKWVKDRWMTNWGGSDLDLMNAPVMLSAEVLEQLNRICNEKQVPRDAFFDCFLQFLTGRLVDAALVIKDPRTGQDIGSQLVDVMNDEELSDKETRKFLFDVTKTWMGGRATSNWDKSLYQERLHYDASRVDTERLMLEAFSGELQKAK